MSAAYRRRLAAVDAICDSYRAWFKDHLTTATKEEFDARMRAWDLAAARSRQLRGVR